METTQLHMLLTFSQMLFGHLWADYMLQPQWMAEQKGSAGRKGLAVCLLHCTLYVVCTALCCWRADPIFLLVVFLSHFPIDRWSLGRKWLRLIKGRDFLEASLEPPPFGGFRTGFACHVYVVVDFTLHATMLLLALRFGLL